MNTNTEIRIMSDISFHQYINRNFENITITGYNSPVVMCDHQGGVLVGYSSTLLYKILRGTNVKHLCFVW